MNSAIAAIRKDYQLRSLTEADVAGDPIHQFTRWWEEAIKSDVEEVNAMTLATASKAGVPAARIVLLKDFDAKGFVFFTNYNSEKGQHLAENPNAALVFFWKELERQVCIEGVVEKADAAESDAYYQSRPVGSRIGAWASPQSEIIQNRELIENNVKRYESEFQDRSIPRPPHWGGYLLRPHTIEFWQGRSSRLHDRLQYRKEADHSWHIYRLAP